MYKNRNNEEVHVQRQKVKINNKCIQNSIRLYNQMEETQKILELKDLSFHEMVQQFKDFIQGMEVDKLTIFAIFKGRKQKQRTRLDRNLQDKTYEALNFIKHKKVYEENVDFMKCSFKSIPKQAESFQQEAHDLYQNQQYDYLIEILQEKLAQLQSQKQKQTYTSEASNSQFQYNFATFTLGNCYYRLKNYDIALQYYQKIQNLQPKHQHAQRMNNLGTCFAKKKSYQQALKCYNEAIKFYNQTEDEDISGLLNNIAMIYLKCEMFVEAEKYFTESINQRKIKSPNNKIMLYTSYFHLGFCQNKNGKFQDSISNLFIALSYASDGVGKKIDVYHELCIAYQQSQKWTEALSYYEKLSEQYESIKKPQALIFQRVSKIHERLGNTLMAAKFAKKAFKIYYAEGNQRKTSQMSASPLVNMPNNY